jgi:hypothetical protein
MCRPRSTATRITSGLIDDAIELLIVCQRPVGTARVAVSADGSLELKDGDPEHLSFFCGIDKLAKIAPRIGASFERLNVGAERFWSGVELLEKYRFDAGMFEHHSAVSRQLPREMDVDAIATRQYVAVAPGRFAVVLTISRIQA